MEPGIPFAKLLNDTKALLVDKLQMPLDWVKHRNYPSRLKADS